MRVCLCLLIVLVVDITPKIFQISILTFPDYLRNLPDYDTLLSTPSAGLWTGVGISDPNIAQPLAGRVTIGRQIYPIMPSFYNKWTR